MITHSDDLSPLNTFKQNEFLIYFLASAIYPKASLHFSVT